MTRVMIVDAIAKEEECLSRLQREENDARGRRAALRADLATAAAELEIRIHLPVVTDARAPRTGAEKLELFRSLFRGRADVFPTRFVSKKTGKPGYAPACRNKFV